jgi:hypothetical protein
MVIKKHKQGEEKKKENLTNRTFISSDLASVSIRWTCWLDTCAHGDWQYHWFLVLNVILSL